MFRRAFSTVVKLNNFQAVVPQTAVAKTLSLETASQKEITQFKVGNAVRAFQKHDGDTGSAPVQIAAMTERILSLARHFASHKKDKHSMRGFQILIARRRKMMKYLKSYDFEDFKKTVKKLNLEKEAVHL